jgi:WXG100 family type VII secretion target
MRYHVDAQEVAAAAAAAGASGERIRGEVAGMVGRLAQLESSWSGSAAAAFAGVLAEWRSAQAHVEQALAALTQALGSAATHYDDAEATAARLFGR